MCRHVKRKHLIDLVNQYYNDQEKNCKFCCKSLCLFCQSNLENELRGVSTQDMPSRKNGL